MIEMMVAIVILGLGMLMAATMFPVGWLRARDLAEFTTETSAAESAATTVRLLCHPANPQGGVLPNPVTTSFLGDFDPMVLTGLNDDVAIPNDPYVHVLHVENALADPGVIATPDDLIMDEWYKAGTTNFLDPQLSVAVDPTAIDWWDLPLVRVPPLAQIAFHERIFPPLPRRPLTTDVPPPTPAQFDQWNSTLRARRFAWAVLYKFDDPLPTTPTATRNMTFYYVTLRRTRELQRFARQDPQNGVGALATIATLPIALPPEEDTLFPVPWLVRIKVLGSWDAAGFPQTPTGLPSEAVANPDLDPKARLIAQMLQPGSVLIDMLNGNIYTVREHRFTGQEGNFDHQATVTLDREVTETDVGLDPTNPNDQVAIGAGPFNPNTDWRNFWIFPPSVLPEPNTRAGGYVTFEGNQPVVGVATRQMYLSP